MKLEYDQTVDALEISLGGGMVSRTVEIDPGTLVDLDEHGNVVAIEIIRLSRPWPLEEVLERFSIDDDDAAVLRALWHEGVRYPFAAPLALA